MLLSHLRVLVLLSHPRVLALIIVDFGSEKCCIAMSSWCSAAVMLCRRGAVLLFCCVVVVQCYCTTSWACFIIPFLLSVCVSVSVTEFSEVLPPFFLPPIFSSVRVGGVVVVVGGCGSTDSGS